MPCARIPRTFRFRHPYHINEQNMESRDIHSYQSQHRVPKTANGSTLCSMLTYHIPYLSIIYLVRSIFLVKPSQPNIPEAIRRVLGHDYQGFIHFISFLLTVSAQKLLLKVPRSCSVPKSPPTCMYSIATLYFKSCGIYNGGNCPRFCHSLQA